jgi:hypothetical protein
LRVLQQRQFGLERVIDEAKRDMRAAWYETQGPAREVLKVGIMADPTPGPGEVRIRIAASGINPDAVRGPDRSGFRKFCRTSLPDQCPRKMLASSAGRDDSGCLETSVFAKTNGISEANQDECCSPLRLTAKI